MITMRIYIWGGDNDSDDSCGNNSGDNDCDNGDGGVVVLEMATAPRVGVDSQALVAEAQGWLVCKIS